MCLGQLSYCFHNIAHPIIYWLCVYCLFVCFSVLQAIYHFVYYVYVLQCGLCVCPYVLYRIKVYTFNRKSFWQNSKISCQVVVGYIASLTAFPFYKAIQKKMAMHGWNIWLDMLLAVVHALPIHNSQDQVLALSPCLYGTCLCHCSPLLSNKSISIAFASTPSQRQNCPLKQDKNITLGVCKTDVFCLVHSYQVSCQTEPLIFTHKAIFTHIPLRACMHA